MGRLIVRALESAGHEVRIAASFRSWTKTGDETVQRAIRANALQEAEQIGAQWQNEGYRPDIFLTYHLYHKAPDWIGPALADRFDLPYAILEASRAPKRKTGDWAFGFAEADKALHRADMIGALHNADAGCLKPVLPEERLSIVLPFIDAAPYQTVESRPHPSIPLKLLAVGMMRAGDKTRSYRILAEALDKVSDLPWHLTIVGDGEARDEVLPLFPKDRTTWFGALAMEELPAHYATHDLFVWPAIREAFGLVFLEAQASGLAVIAGDTFGVPDIVKDQVTGLLSAEGDAVSFAANLRKMLENPELVQKMGQAAARHISARHALQAGARRLDDFLASAIANHTSRTTS